MIEFKLVGPSPDNGEDYWHIDIINRGEALVENALLHLVANRANGKVEFFNNIRFVRPYEGHDQAFPPRFTIRPGETERVDFFSTEKGGRLQLAFQPTKIKLPKEAGDNLVVGFQLIADGCHKSDIGLVRLTRTARSWLLEDAHECCLEPF